MTPKQRLLAAIRGNEVDRLPWSPFLAYFWESQSEHIQEEGQIKFLEEIGADPLLRGSHQLFTIQRRKCYIHNEEKVNERLVVYETPLGNLKSRYVFSPSGHTWFLVEHPVKTEEDFKILTYINEDISIVPNVEVFCRDYNEIGDRALYIPIIGSEFKSSFQSLIEHWVGTEELVYALMDYPETVEECLAAMSINSLKTVEISVDSPAEAFIFWEDSSTTNTSPEYFKKYAAPEIDIWGRIIHKAGKYLIHHACGHLRALIPHMSKMEIDMIESISPPPTGNIELWEARIDLPESIGLVGGIEPTVFLNSTIEELEEYVDNLIRKMGTKRFILANSDSCPPGVKLEKFKLVSDIVSRRG